METQRSAPGRHHGKRMISGSVTLALITFGVLIAPRSHTVAPAIQAGDDLIAPKVLTLAMFQTGDLLAGGSSEATPWVQKDRLDRTLPIPGGASPL